MITVIILALGCSLKPPDASAKPPFFKNLPGMHTLFQVKLPSFNLSYQYLCDKDSKYIKIQGFS